MFRKLMLVLGAAALALTIALPASASHAKKPPKAPQGAVAARTVRAGSPRGGQDLQCAAAGRMEDASYRPEGGKEGTPRLAESCEEGAPRHAEGRKGDVPSAASEPDGGRAAGVQRTAARREEGSPRHAARRKQGAPRLAESCEEGTPRHAEGREGGVPHPAESREGGLPEVASSSRHVKAAPEPAPTEGRLRRSVSSGTRSPAMVERICTHLVSSAAGISVCDLL